MTAADSRIAEFIGWIDEGARELQRDRSADCGHGYEYVVADKVMQRLTGAGHRKAVLRFLVRDALISVPLPGGGALDERYPETFEVLGQCADLITETAWPQIQADMYEDGRLREMIADQIRDALRAREGG
jgi:hypothetical protein